MRVPLSFIDINIWLALQTILLFITAELLSPHYDKINILIDKRRFRKVTISIAVLFFITIIIYFIDIIIL